VRDIVVLANVLVTGYLTGLIWTIQIVHYPLFMQVGADAFPAYHRLHSSRISAIVAAPMAVELLLSVVLALYRPALFPASAAWACLLLTALVWLSTFVVSVPIHKGLSSGHDATRIARLVLTNWPRTIAWTLRLIILALGTLTLLR